MAKKKKKNVDELISVETDKSFSDPNYVESDVSYEPRDTVEEHLVKKFQLRRDDAKKYFDLCIKPNLDLAFKLHSAYSGDRAKEIKKWQANVFVPYIQAVVETLMPRILDARPEFSVQGRNDDDQEKADKLNRLADYTWETIGMDSVSENFVRAALIYGTSYLQVGWKKDVRKLKFLDTKDINSDSYSYKTEERTFYDGPWTEWVDNYTLLYDWHNTPRASKQDWFKRLLLTKEEIIRRYPFISKDRLNRALNASPNDDSDWAAVRNDVKKRHDRAVKGADYDASFEGSLSRSDAHDDVSFKLHEVYEWWVPFQDGFGVFVNDVPVIDGVLMPIPFDFKDAPFISLNYMSLPGEFEGLGIPLILESPQLTLNMIKNQRLDAATMNIHKMWVVSPMANIDKKDLIVRPFGIVWSNMPDGVREVNFSDIKSSAYQEEQGLKGDMRYASGVDDFSMGVGGGANSATETRHLRESTLERVRLFINHLGDSYATMFRWWISLYSQFYTKEIVIRVVDSNGDTKFPIIEKDDLFGNFDFKAMVIPSIAGKNDIEKKQNMDLFQLLANMEFIDLKKLTAKTIKPWSWNIESLMKDEAPVDPAAMMGQGMPGMPGMPGVPPSSGSPMMQEGGPGIPKMPNVIPSSAMQSILAGVGPVKGFNAGSSSMGELASPVNLLNSSGTPPTVKGVGQTSNPRGMSRGGKVNTNIPLKENNSASDRELQKAANIQR